MASVFETHGAVVTKFWSKAILLIMLTEPAATVSNAIHKFKL